HLGSVAELTSGRRSKKRVPAAGIVEGERPAEHGRLCRSSRSLPSGRQRWQLEDDSRTLIAVLCNGRTVLPMSKSRSEDVDSRCLTPFRSWTARPFLRETGEFTRFL